MNVLIFTGGQGPSFSDLRDFINRTGTIHKVIAVDSGLEYLDSFNSTCPDLRMDADFIIGDMDSLKNRELLLKYPKAKIQEYPADKDYTDTELGLICGYNLRLWVLPKKRGFQDKGLTILCGGDGGRIDHFLSIYENFCCKWHPDVMLGSCQALYFLGKGKTLEFSRIKPEESISVARLFGSGKLKKNGRIYTEGLEWQGEKFNSRGMPSVSNRISRENTEGRVKFRSRNQDFIVIVPLGALLESKS